MQHLDPSNKSDDTFVSYERENDSLLSIDGIPLPRTKLPQKYVHIDRNFTRLPTSQESLPTTIHIVDISIDGGLEFSKS
jgi:hypothetical protein